tara:strand:+ start:467 stop:985 length:519 start_codon:yes stop_codon:yes gene_type:complete
MSLIRAENNHICWLTDLGDATMWRCQNCGIQVTAPDRETAETEALMHRDVNDDTTERITSEQYYELLLEYAKEVHDEGWTCDCVNCKYNYERRIFNRQYPYAPYQEPECEDWMGDVQETFDQDLFGWNGNIENTDRYEFAEKLKEATKNYEDGFIADDCGTNWGINGLITKI